MGDLNPGSKNSLCGIHFAPDFIASVPVHGYMAKQSISFLMAANHKQPGGFSVTGFKKRMSAGVPEFYTSPPEADKSEAFICKIQVVIKENNCEAFLPRFGGGSGGDNNICNDGMGATVTGNRHHNQRIRI
jgi:hypothetical protein